MECIAQIIHDGVSQQDSRVRTGLILVTDIAMNVAIAATVQPPEVALGGMVFISAATLVEALHQAKNMETRGG